MGFYAVHDNDEELIDVGRRSQGMHTRLYKAVMKQLRKFPRPEKDVPTNCVSCDEGDASLFIWVKDGKTEFIISHADEQRVYDVPKDLRKGVPDKYLKPLVEAFISCCENTNGKTKRRPTNQASSD